MRRRNFKSELKCLGLTESLALILEFLSTDEAGGIYDVAVKCIDIIKNPNCEGSLLGSN